MACPRFCILGYWNHPQSWKAQLPYRNEVPAVAHLTLLPRIARLGFTALTGQIQRRSNSFDNPLFTQIPLVKNSIFQHP
jgi:hypothetical protein